MNGATIAVYGATSELGRELCRNLQERCFPLTELRLLDSARAIEEADDDFAAPLLDAAAADVEGVELAFLCGSERESRDWTARAMATGALVIDLSSAHADRADVPVVVPEVNADSLLEFAGEQLVASPVPGAIALSIVLNPLEKAARLKRVIGTCLEPVSSAGRAGIEELARQTEGLLGGREAEPRVFSRRIAFNAIPQSGDFVAGGRTRGEWLIEEQTRRVLDLPDLPLAVTVVRVPIFFGHGYVLNVETEEPIDAATASALFGAAPGIHLLEGVGPDSYATPADVIGGEATYVSRVRDDPTVPFGISLWVTLDGMRKGGAVNAVQIAEIARREWSRSGPAAS